MSKIVFISLTGLIGLTPNAKLKLFANCRVSSRTSNLNVILQVVRFFALLVMLSCWNLAAQVRITGTSPARITVAAGQAFELSVTAQGANRYQWKLDGRVIEGATNPQLQVANSGSSGNGGLYAVEVSATTANSSTSQYRIFRVMVAPRAGSAAYTCFPITAGRLLGIGGYDSSLFESNFTSVTNLIGRTDIIDISPYPYANIDEDRPMAAVTSSGQALSLRGQQLPQISNLFAIGAQLYYILRDGTVKALRRRIPQEPWTLADVAGVSDVVDIRSAYPTAGNIDLALTSDGAVYQLIQAADGRVIVTANVNETKDAIFLTGEGVVKWDGHYYAWGVGPTLDLREPRERNTVGAAYFATASRSDIMAYLRSDGRVVSRDRDGYYNAPANFVEITKIVTYGSAVLGLKRDGTVVYWDRFRSNPSNFNPQSADRRFMTIEAGLAIYETIAADYSIGISRPMGSVSANLQDNITLSANSTAPSFPPLFATWTKDGTVIRGSKEPTFTLDSANASTSGTYRVALSNGISSTSDTAQVSIMPASPPVLVRAPAALTVKAGERAVLEIVVSGSPTPSIQWLRNGSQIQGATGTQLSFPSSSISDSGLYSAVVRGSFNGSVTTLTTNPVRLEVLPPAPRLSNLSVRTTLGANQLLIVGMTMSGGSKNVLLRAVGPTLGVFGVPAVMSDPKLDLYNGSSRIASNDNWQGASALVTSFQNVGAFAYSTPASLDAALLTAIDGGRTVQVSGPSAGTVLVEGYDAGTGDSPRFSNLSARNRVGTGSDILIAGFTLSGNGTRNLLIRAVGPKLSDFGVSGVLQDPKLQIFSGATRIAENDNWSANLASTFSAVGAFALTTGSKDAAIVIPLQAGSYTVQVSGADGSTGEAIVEIYELP